MNTAAGLPLPQLSRGRFAYCAVGDINAAPDKCAVEAGIWAYSDNTLYDACGVRIAFAEREGGISRGYFASLNMKKGIGDTDAAVLRNQQILCASLGVNVGASALVSPNQVHGSTIVSIDEASPAALLQAQQQAEAGADAVSVTCLRVAALLCFADCMPIIFVAPTGAFAVAHCGWRGVVAHLAPKTAIELAGSAGCSTADLNVYIGPYIHKECFAVGEPTVEIFTREFDASVIEESTRIPNQWNVDLGAAVMADLRACGIDKQRVADVDICTACNTDRFFSYRASNGNCGRHAAFAIRF